jgi:hypothetical protein
MMSKFGSGVLVLGLSLAVVEDSAIATFSPLTQNSQCPTSSKQQINQRLASWDFLVFGGGGEPDNNEIALEKNLLYFQRTLTSMGYPPTVATMFFANGNNGQATVRYIDDAGNQKFKVPAIPDLKGASTVENLKRSLTSQSRSNKPIFFYFTGHGALNKKDANNNALVMWNDDRMTVRQLAAILDRFPTQDSNQKPFVTMMAQCYSGSFANLIYTDGDPSRAVAPQNRCGFFATIKTLPSVGCTPAVDESDYRDYSSSFFAGLSGRDRTGKSVSSADYNRDGRISFTEAHAFAKVDEATSDLPISTSEAWLQNQSSMQLRYQIFSQPITKLLQTARPEQRYVVTALTKKFGMNPNFSLSKNKENLSLDPNKFKTEEDAAYFIRLQMELINIGIEKQIRNSGSSKNTTILNRILNCENS